MKAVRWTMVSLLALAGVSCGSDGGGGASTEKWCDLATSIDTKFNDIDAAFGAKPDEMKSLFKELTSTLQDAVDAAPAAIKDEVEKTADAFKQFDDELAKADYNILDVDQGALSALGADMDDASAKIESFNKDECGIEPDTTAAGTEDTSGDATGDTLGEGTARDQMTQMFEKMGLTKDEAACIADNIDPAMAAKAESDPTVIMNVFEKCDISLSRLAEIGSQTTGG